MVAHDRYNPQRFPHPFRAGVAKSVDAVDSKSTVEIRAGSSPAFGTIGTSIDVNGRLFLCLKSSIRKAFLAFSLNLSQPDSIYINLLMRVQLRVTGREVDNLIHPSPPSDVVLPGYQPSVRLIQNS